ncbi:MAG: hypothetical protein N2C14_06225, partial [Planctomycetales bacterium]
TVAIFFDLEFLVPPEDRSDVGASLNVNPFRENHVVLGGAFARGFPLKSGGLDALEYQEFWLWKERDERAVLAGMLDFFRESWKLLAGKKSNQADLITVGVGIGRVDLPVLLARCVELEIAPRAELFDCFCKTKVVDLGAVAIPFFPNGTPILHPKTNNEITKRFGVSSDKPSGKKVWRMYEDQDHAGIEQRTRSEVETCVRLYQAAVDQVFHSRDDPKR